MTEVFLLWRIAHADAPDGEEQRHHDPLGEPLLDEQEGDDPKLLGVYSTQAAARARIEVAQTLPGFADEPDCFMIDSHLVDHDEWTEGFMRLR